MSSIQDVLGEIEGAAVGPIAAAASAVDARRAFPVESIERLGELGALGLTLPESAGGLGGGLTDLARACESLGRACASTGMVFLMHSVTAATIGAGAGPAADAALSAIGDGALATLAFSERGTGAHFYSPELSAERHNGGVRVSGRKSFVTSGGYADIYMLLLQGEADGTADAYLVEKGAPGISFEGEWTGLGMTGNASVAAELEDLQIPDEARVGEPGTALELVFSTVAPLFLVGLAAVNVGIAGAAAGAAVEHARNRRYPDGSTLAEVPAIQHMIASMDTSTRAARLLVQEAARLGDAADESALVAIMESKVVATETAASVSGRALEVTGGQGYTRSLPIERHLRDARAGAVMAPTNAVLRTWIGKAVTGLPVP
jgi:isovaleryl-CoA dehydrogenase